MHVAAASHCAIASTRAVRPPFIAVLLVADRCVSTGAPAMATAADGGGWLRLRLWTRLRLWKEEREVTAAPTVCELRLCTG